MLKIKVCCDSSQRNLFREVQSIACRNLCVTACTGQHHWFKPQLREVCGEHASKKTNTCQHPAFCRSLWNRSGKTPRWWRRRIWTVCWCVQQHSGDHSPKSFGAATPFIFKQRLHEPLSNGTAPNKAAILRMTVSNMSYLHNCKEKYTSQCRVCQRAAGDHSHTLLLARTHHPTSHWIVVCPTHGGSSSLLQAPTERHFIMSTVKLMPDWDTGAQTSFSTAQTGWQL